VRARGIGVGDSRLFFLLSAVVHFPAAQKRQPPRLRIGRPDSSVQLTSAGETLLGYSRTIIRLNEDACLRFSGVRHAGRVRVGVQEDLTDSWLPKLLRCFCRRYPELEVELEIGLGPKLFEMVDSQELDLAVAGLCNETAEGRKLWSEPLTWAFSAEAEVPDVLPLAFYPEPCPYREAALRALAGTRKQWRVVSTVPVWRAYGRQP
jgi:DNA-binding transcriptional LysR family regulator